MMRGVISFQISGMGGLMVTSAGGCAVAYLAALAATSGAEGGDAPRDRRQDDGSSFAAHCRSAARGMAKEFRAMLRKTLALKDSLC
jgi:hypothetical protein